MKTTLATLKRRLDRVDADLPPVVQIAVSMAETPAEALDRELQADPQMRARFERWIHHPPSRTDLPASYIGPMAPLAIFLVPPAHPALECDGDAVEIMRSGSITSTVGGVRSLTIAGKDDTGAASKVLEFRDRAE